MAVIGGAAPARASWWRPHLHASALAFDLTAALLALGLALAVSRTPIGAGDYGQWLMVSRVYSGESTPAYRDLLAVPPLIPALLALIRVPMGDPFRALDVLRCLLAAGLLLSFYAAGTSLFRSRAAGLFAALFAALLTDRFLELFAFGGLLQAAAIIFLLLTVACFARLARVRGEAEERRWWTLAAVSFALGVLSHTGSVVALAPVAALSAVFILARDFRRRPVRAWLPVVAPSALIAAGASLYWLIVLVPANRGYNSNPASLAYRGPDRLWDDLTSGAPGLALLALGGVATCALVGEAVARRRFEPGATLLAAWALSAWGVVLLTVAAGSGTDYPRFAPILLAPLCVAAGALVARLVEMALPLASRWMPELDLAQAAIGVGAAVLILRGPVQLAAFDGQAGGYRMTDRDGISAVAAWIDGNLGSQESVLALDSRDGKWIEGLSGSPALFSNPVRYSFREYEWERQIAAEALVRSTLSLVNGQAFAMFTAHARTPSEDVPRNLLLAFNHDGEFVDMLRLPETDARVLAGDAAGGILATLGALQPVSSETFESAEAISVRTVARGERRGETVTWTRTVTLTRDSGVVDVIDEVDTTAPVAGMEVLAAAPGWAPMLDAAAVGPIAEVVYPNQGSRNPSALIRVEDGSVARTADGIVASVEGNRVHLRLQGLTTGGPISRLALLTPAALMDTYDVGAIVLKDGPSLAARLERLLPLGLCREFEAGSYVVLGDGCLDRGGSRIPFLAADDPTGAR